MERQVIINGKVSEISKIESDKYFNSRPRSSQLEQLFQIKVKLYLQENIWKIS